MGSNEHEIDLSTSVDKVHQLRMTGDDDQEDEIARKVNSIVFIA